MVYSAYMKGGKNRQPLGYTIIEVMIVLAISGTMFLIAAQFINGKQERTAFKSGVNDTSSQLQDVIEQVTDGKFSDIPLQCTCDTSVHCSSSVTPNQGSNYTCTFLGKIMRFTQNSPNYILSSVAGTLSSGDNSPNIDNSYPAGYVYPATIADLDVNQLIPQSLTVKSVTVTDTNGTAHNYYTVGFIQSLGSTTGVDFQSGGQTVQLVYAPLSSAQSSDNANYTSGVNLQYAQSVAICVEDGAQTSKITIGGNGSSQLQPSITYIPAGSPCP